MEVGKPNNIPGNNKRASNGHSHGLKEVKGKEHDEQPDEQEEELHRGGSVPGLHPQQVLTRRTSVRRTEAGCASGPTLKIWLVEHNLQNILWNCYHLLLGHRCWPGGLACVNSSVSVPRCTRCDTEWSVCRWRQRLCCDCRSALLIWTCRHLIVVSAKSEEQKNGV